MLFSMNLASCLQHLVNCSLFFVYHVSVAARDVGTKDMFYDLLYFSIL